MGLHAQLKKSYTVKNVTRYLQVQINEQELQHEKDLADVRNRISELLNARQSMDKRVSKHDGQIVEMGKDLHITA